MTTEYSSRNPSPRPSNGAALPEVFVREPAAGSPFDLLSTLEAQTANTSRDTHSSVHEFDAPEDIRVNPPMPEAERYHTHSAQPSGHEEGNIRGQYTGSPSGIRPDSDGHGVEPFYVVPADRRTIFGSVSRMNGHPGQGRSRPATHRGLFKRRVVQHAAGPGHDSYETRYPADRSGYETGHNARVWRVYLDEAEAYDAEMVEEWKDTVDTLLVFAGLFSAVVTTFVAQTSQSLQQDYTEISASLLTELVALNRASSEGRSPDTVPASQQNISTPFVSATSDRFVNGLWFISLAFSLVTALSCILIKQWAQHYTSSMSGTSSERALRRQLRFDGLKQWHVRSIVGILPLLMHIALLLFSAGLVLFLRSLDSNIGWVMCGIAGITLLTYSIATVLPVLYVECPYHTPICDFYQVVLFHLTTWNERVLAWTRRSLSLLKARFPGRMAHTRGVDLGTAYNPPNSPKIRPETSLRKKEYNTTLRRKGHLTARCTRWLLVSTTKPSVTRITYQSFAAFRHSSFLYLLPYWNAPSRRIQAAFSNFLADWEYAVHIAEHTADTQPENTATELLTVERMSRAIVKLMSYPTVVNSSPIPLEKLGQIGNTITKAITLLTLSSPEDTKSLRECLDALRVTTIGPVPIMMDGGQSASAESLFHRLLEFDLEDRDYLAIFLRYIGNYIFRSSSPQYSLPVTSGMKADCCHRLLDVLGYELRSNLRSSHHGEHTASRGNDILDGYNTAFEAAICLYNVLHCSSLTSDPRILSVGVYGNKVTFDNAPTPSMYLGYCNLILASVTNFTALPENEGWSSKHLIRRSITRCINWVYAICVSVIGTDTTLAIQSTNEYQRRRWPELVDIREMWSQDIVKLIRRIKDEETRSGFVMADRASDHSRFREDMENLEHAAQWMG